MVSGLKILLSCALIALVAASGYWLGTKRVMVNDAVPMKAVLAPAAPASGPALASVEVAAVMVGKLPQSIEAVGSLRSDESVILRPETSGRIGEILFKEGQRVTKGATLVRLDASVQRAELQQAEANLGLARSKFERALDLQKTGFISAQAREEAENNLKLGEAAFRLANARLAKLDITAPFSGTMGLRQVSVGDYVREGQDMANLEEIDPIKVDFRVPEIFIKEVSPGQTVQVTFDAFANQIFEGKIAAINPLLDANGRALVVRAVVRNADARLRPGMFARVRLITNRLEEAMTIPEQALVPQGDDVYVFRLVGGRVARTKIEIGQRREGGVEVRRGLEKTDQVVTAGQGKIRDGVAVNIVKAQAPRGVSAGGAVAPAAAKS